MVSIIENFFYKSACFIWCTCTYTCAYVCNNVHACVHERTVRKKRANNIHSYVCILCVVLVVMTCAWGALAGEATCLLFECGCLVFSGLASKSMKCGELFGTSSEKITSIADRFTLHGPSDWIYIISSGGKMIRRRG